jgi:hypothetical protein
MKRRSSFAVLAAFLSPAVLTAVARPPTREEIWRRELARVGAPAPARFVEFEVGESGYSESVVYEDGTGKWHGFRRYLEPSVLANEPPGRFDFILKWFPASA